jgi:hypothetical protein
MVALIVDESASQRLGNRTQQTEQAVAAVKERLQALGGFEVREVHATTARTATARRSSPN